MLSSANLLRFNQSHTRIHVGSVKTLTFDTRLVMYTQNNINGQTVRETRPRLGLMYMKIKRCIRDAEVKHHKRKSCLESVSVGPPALKMHISSVHGNKSYVHTVKPFSHDQQKT